MGQLTAWPGDSWHSFVNPDILLSAVEDGAVDLDETVLGECYDDDDGQLDPQAVEDTPHHLDVGELPHELE